MRTGELTGCKRACPCHDEGVRRTIECSTKEPHPISFKLIPNQDIVITFTTESSTVPQAITLCNSGQKTVYYCNCEGASAMLVLEIQDEVSVHGYAMLYTMLTCGKKWNKLQFMQAVRCRTVIMDSLFSTLADPLCN